MVIPSPPPTDEELIAEAIEAAMEKVEEGWNWTCFHKKATSNVEPDLEGVTLCDASRAFDIVEISMIRLHMRAGVDVVLTRAVESAGDGQAVLIECVHEDVEPDCSYDLVSGSGGYLASGSEGELWLAELWDSYQAFQ